MTSDRLDDALERWIAAWTLDLQGRACNHEPRPLCWPECGQGAVVPWCRRQSELRW